MMIFYGLLSRHMYINTMLCIMGIRRGFCIVGICTLGNRLQRTHGVF